MWTHNQTTATAPPRVSYLQPLYAAVHHDIGLRIGKTTTRGPRIKVRSHVSKYKISRFPRNYVVFALPILLSFLTQSYTLQIVMIISNLPIPQDDPRGHPLRKTRKPGPAHRRVFSQHPHRAQRGRITLSPQPPFPLRHHSSKLISESYFYLRNSRRQPTA